MDGAVEHPGQKLTAHRKAAGDRDLGTMEHDRVGKAGLRQRRADQPERNGRIEHDERRARRLGEREHLSGHRRGR